MTAQAFSLRENVLASGTPEDFLPFFDGKKHVISLVGGGGKPPRSIIWLRALPAVGSARAF